MLRSLVRQATHLAERARRREGVPSLVALLEDDDAKCACAAAHVIRNLASDDKGRRALLINGGAAALSAAGLEGDDEATQLRVEAIANLCLGDAADRTAVVNAKCIRPSRSAPTC